MTLRRKMAYEIAAMIVGLLLISAASLWGLNGLHQEFDSAIQGYEELRRVYEIGSHVATARALLSMMPADAERAMLEVRTAADKLALYASAGLTSLGEPNPRQAFYSTIGSRLAEANDASREKPGAIAEPLNDALTQAANLASEIRRQIEQKQRAADSKRRTTLVVMSLLSAAVVMGAVIIGVAQYRSVTRPLRQLGDAARRIASGNFAERIPVGGPAEFTALADDFNCMAGELDGLYRELEQKVAAKSRELVRSERLASVGYLAAGVAHEVNNPIGIIAGHAEFSLQQLQRSQDEHTLAEIQNTLRIICDEAFRCKGIVTKLLSLARPGEENRRPVSLAAVAGSVVSTIAGLGVYRSRRLLLDAEENKDLHVVANEGEMKQVLLNLAINALEAVTEGGEVRIAISRVNEFVELSVTDNGRGMSTEVRERVFEPFFTSKRGSGQPGAGLGLSITHAIVQSHGGQIEAYSDGPGRGSRFVVRLPAAELVRTA